MSEPAIFRIERLELSFAPKPWAFALERRAEIDAYFAALRREKPAVWNGRVLLLYRHAVRDDVLLGDYLEIDYASFAAWVAWGLPPVGAQDCFGAAAVVAADGAVLLGMMAPHTFNAGQTPTARPIPATSSAAKSISTSACGANSRRRPGWRWAMSLQSRAGRR